MENKFYTPEIEEFHVGFDFEMYSGYEWVKQIFPKPWWESNNGMGRYDVLQNCINGEHVRVKFLDREDIEECGWKCDTTSRDLLIFHYKDDYYGTSLTYELDGSIEIIVKESTIFAGTIKNKSELKRIMKMLNIE